MAVYTDGHAAPFSPVDVPGTHPKFSERAINPMG